MQYMTFMKKTNKAAFIISICTVLFFNVAFSEAKDFFGITDYKPSKFQEKVSTPFFFSIGRQLKFGDSISEEAPTVFKSSWFSDKMMVYPSPDGKKAVVASGGNLYLVEIEKEPQFILKKAYNPKFNGNIEKNYQHHSIQWNRDSTLFFIPMMTSINSVVQHQIIKIYVNEQFDLSPVLPNFFLHYFLMGDDNICFDFAPGNGGVIWYCQSNGISKKIDRIIEGTGGIKLEDGSVLPGKPFASYNGNIYETDIWLTRYGFSLKRDSGRTIGFYSRKHGDEPIFKLQGGNNFKGYFVDGISQRGGLVLPGGRYAILHVYHDNFTGQLLVDGETGRYRELPKDTNVYLNLNSWEYKLPVFKIDNYPEGRIGRFDFLPYDKLKSY